MSSLLVYSPHEERNKLEQPRVNCLVLHTLFPRQVKSLAVRLS